MNKILSTLTEIIRINPEFVKLLDWHEISKIPGLTDQFIEEYADFLHFPTICLYQPLTLAIINKLENKIDYTFLVKNPNLSDEVKDSKVDKMDWELFQMNQTFSKEFITKHIDNISPILIFKYQKLSEDVIFYFIGPHIESEKWAMLKGQLDLIFQYQKVSMSFIRKMLELEDEIIEKVFPKSVSTEEKIPESAVHEEIKKRPQIIVSIPAILQYQQVDEEFIKNCVLQNDNLLMTACFYQKLTSDFVMKLLEFVKSSEQFSALLQVALKYQRFNKEDIMRICDYFDISSADNYLLILEHQEYDYELFQWLMRKIPAEFVPVAYILAFLRGISGSLQDNLSYRKDIIENINWQLLSERQLKKDELVAILNPEKEYIEKLVWYFFLKNNNLDEEILSKNYISDHLGAIEWWLLLTNERPTDMKFSEVFANKHKDKKKWWKFIPEQHIMEFYKQCLESLKNLPSEKSGVRQDHLAQFLKEFAEKGDWNTILRHEDLDEWFIRIFQNFDTQIEMFWWKLCRYQKLSEKFIRTHMIYLDLNVVLGYQKLSEEFLEEHAPFFDDDCWDKVSRYQPLTEEFQKKYIDKLNKIMLSFNEFVVHII
jgi:hypothetical protein